MAYCVPVSWSTRSLSQQMELQHHLFLDLKHLAKVSSKEYWPVSHFVRITEVLFPLSSPFKSKRAPTVLHYSPFLGLSPSIVLETTKSKPLPQSKNRWEMSCMSFYVARKLNKDYHSEEILLGIKLKNNHWNWLIF